MSPLYLVCDCLTLSGVVGSDAEAALPPLMCDPPDALSVTEAICTPDLRSSIFISLIYCRKMRDTTTIKISKELRKRLKILKAEDDYRSYEELLWDEIPVERDDD